MFIRLVARLNAYFEAREARSTLEGLSDAALADIGLDRASLWDLQARPDVQARNEAARQTFGTRRAAAFGNLFAPSAPQPV